MKKRDLNPGGSDSESWRSVSGNTDPRAMELWKMKARLNIGKEGLLRLKFNGGKLSSPRPFGKIERNGVIIPNFYKNKIMYLVHRSPTAAHMGMRRTWQRARNSF